MQWWGVAELVGLLTLLAVGVPLVSLFARRRWLSRQSGMIDVGLRPHADAPGGGWMLGLARYHGEQFQWFRVFSLAMRPRWRFEQGEWTVLGARDLEPGEEDLLYAGQRVLHLRDKAGDELDLAMDAPSVTGFMSWLEAASPGQRHYGNTVA